MKIALITDTHWGIRSDNESFHNISKKFMDEVFFKYIDDNEIRTVIHLGDLVDRRKYININTARRLREDFIEPLAERELDTHIILGNHDVYYRNTNEVNSVKELIKDRYPNIKLYENEATEINFDGLDILLIPWICEDNHEQVFEKINTTKAQVAMGHLEIKGFEMFKGSGASHGFDRTAFNKFDMVMSGHFHHRSTDGQIYYLGAHSEFTWSDYNDPKGFHIFDTETRELKFIQNPFKMFSKVEYDDSEGDIQDTFDYSKFNRTYVKVIIVSKNNQYWFDKFIERIEKENPIQVQIIEQVYNMDMEEEVINEAESTIDIFKKYVSNYEDKNINKKKLENKILEIYSEAINLE